MKNYKPKLRYLENYHAEALNNLGFRVQSFGNRNMVNEHSPSFEKHYDMCGGCIKLFIRINGYYFGDTYYEPIVKIETPYNSWWSSSYDIKDFTDDMMEFYEELNNDIGALIALGVIEEDKADYDMNFEVYIIQSIDEDEKYRYHMGEGNMTSDIRRSKFHRDYDKAKIELSYFDEPDEFEIKKISVAMKFVDEE